jgi:hypothetical protein
MAAVTSAVTMVASSTDGANVITSSFTPVTGDLLVLLVGTSGLIRPAASFTVISSIANAPGFVPVGQALGNTGADAVYAFVAAGLEVPTARTITITFGGGTAIGTFWGVYRISGMQRTGSGAVRQVAFQNNGAALATPAPVFPAACLTGNPLVGILGNATNPATVTPPAGFTETIDTGGATPAMGQEAVFANSGITASTITWGSTSASVFGALVLEMNTLALTGSDVPQRMGGWGGLQ